jgi:hypothetical protein
MKVKLGRLRITICWERKKKWLDEVRKALIANADKYTIQEILDKAVEEERAERIRSGK